MAGFDEMRELDTENSSILTRTGSRTLELREVQSNKLFPETGHKAQVQET